MSLRIRSVGVLALALVLALIGALPQTVALSQVRDGATMTVLRGQVAVIRADGTADQPAPSGTVVNAGDEIRTLTRTGALLTFFAGTEIELGEDTILLVERVTQEGSRVDVSLKQILGTTVNRVQTLSDPSSSYRIEAGGATAVVRGTTFALIGPVATSQGNIVALVCLDDCTPQTTFSGCPVAPFTGFGVTVGNGRATSSCETFSVDRGADIWNAAFEAVTTFEQTFAQENNVNNPGGANLGRERSTVRSEERARAQDQRDDDTKPVVTEVQQASTSALVSASPPPVVSASPVPTTGTSGGTGSIDGTVTNARTGAGLAGATVQVAGTALSATSGSTGSFALTGIPTGTQTLTTSAPGFISTSRTVTVAEGTNAEQAISLVPTSAAGEISIVLTWGAQPRDLDAHLSGPDRSGGRFHVYFSSKQQPQPNPYAVLDTDNTFGFGPETITISRDPTTGQFVPGEYHYWVDNFSGTPGYNVSDARVTINNGSSQLRSYNVANASGDPNQRIWLVANLTVDASGNVSVADVQQFMTGGSTSVFAVPDGSSPAPSRK